MERVAPTSLRIKTNTNNEAIEERFNLGVVYLNDEFRLKQLKDESAVALIDFKNVVHQLRNNYSCVDNAQLAEVEGIVEQLNTYMLRVFNFVENQI